MLNRIAGLSHGNGRHAARRLSLLKVLTEKPKHICVRSVGR